MRAFALQLPVRDGAWLGARPRLRPLIRSEALGRPAGPDAGVAAADPHRRLALRRGQRGLGGHDPGAGRGATSGRRARRGHRGAHTNNAGSQADLRARRLESWVAEHLGEPVERLVALASQRGWADLVLAGDIALVERIAERAAGQRARAASSTPACSSGAAPRRRPTSWRRCCMRAREERQRELVAEAMDHAAAGGRGAVGDRDVLAALALGRVDHLLVDARDGRRRRHAGRAGGPGRGDGRRGLGPGPPHRGRQRHRRPWPSCGGRRARTSRTTGAGRGGPSPTAFPATDAYLGLGHDTPSARRELSRWLGREVFPGDREALLRAGRASVDAPVPVVAALEAAAGRPPTFHTVYDVWEALTGDAERAPAGRRVPRPAAASGAAAARRRRAAATCVAPTAARRRSRGPTGSSPRREVSLPLPTLLSGRQRPSFDDRVGRTPRAPRGSRPRRPSRPGSASRGPCAGPPSRGRDLLGVAGLLAGVVLLDPAAGHRAGDLRAELVAVARGVAAGRAGPRGRGRAGWACRRPSA